MALEDFSTGSKFTDNSKSEADSDAGDTWAIPETKYGETSEVIDTWLRRHDDRKWVKTGHISRDVDYSSNLIGWCLGVMENLERWKPETKGNRVYKNPYYSG